MEHIKRCQLKSRIQREMTEMNAPGMERNQGIFFQFFQFYCWHRIHKWNFCDFTLMLC